MANKSVALATKDLEEQITDLVRQFEHQTGLVVVNLKVKRRAGTHLREPITLCETVQVETREVEL